MKNNEIYYTDNKEENLSKKKEYIKNQSEKLSNSLSFLKDSIINTDIESLCINDEKFIASFKRPRISLYLNIEDARSCAIETINFSRYEPNDSNLIFGTLSYLSKKNKNFKFFDVGANEGFYSIASLKEFNNIELHLFEAAPETAKMLKENLKLNNLELKNFNEVALSEKIGSEKFIYVPGLSVSSSFKNLVKHETAVEIEVKTITLDFYIENKNTFPDFVKIDVEGAERQVFNGFKNSLKSSKVKPILFVEILRKWSRKFGYEGADFFKEILSYGYDSYCINAENKLQECSELNEETIATNFLFIPEGFEDLEDLKENIKKWV